MLARWAAAGLALFVLLVPVLIAPIPPIADYPNHLARMWLLSSDASLASVAQFYRLQFDTFTNVGIDLVALTLGKLAGFEAAGRVSVAAAVVLPPLGGALLWRSIHGGTHWWMLGFGLLAWGHGLLDAFLNFQIGIGLALAFASLEPRIDRLGPALQIPARAALSLVLLIVHPFGLVFYALLLGALVVGPGGAYPRRRLGRSLGRGGRIGTSLGLVLALFVLTVPSLPGTQEHSGLGTLLTEFRQGLEQFRHDPARKLLGILAAMRSYSNRLDLPTALAFAVPIAWAAALRRLRVHAGLAMLSLGLLAAYLACPDYLLGASWVDARFSIMLPFVLAAAVVPDLPRVPARVAATLLAAALLGRTAVIALVWQARQADVAAVAWALEALPPGAPVLPVEQRPADRATAPPGRYTVVGENSFRHLPALAVPWRQAFVPTLFAARGKQPVEVLPPWNAVSEPNGGQLADVHVLDGGLAPETGHNLEAYVIDWRTRFGYVLVVNADLPDRFGPFAPPAGLSLVRDAGFARLYRIEPPS